MPGSRSATPRSNPTPSNPTPSNPTPRNPTPSNPTPSNPTPSNPTPSNPTPRNPPPRDPPPCHPPPNRPQRPLEQAAASAISLATSRIDAVESVFPQLSRFFFGFLIVGVWTAAVLIWLIWTFVGRLDNNQYVCNTPPAHSAAAPVTATPSPTTSPRTTDTANGANAAVRTAGPPDSDVPVRTDATSLPSTTQGSGSDGSSSFGTDCTNGWSATKDQFQSILVTGVLPLVTLVLGYLLRPRLVNGRQYRISPYTFTRLAELRLPIRGKCPPDLGFCPEFGGSGVCRWVGQACELGKQSRVMGFVAEM